MKRHEVLKQILEAVGTTQVEAGKIIGRNKKLMNDRLVRGTLRYSEFLDILEGIGVEVSYIHKSSGEVIKPEKGKHLETLIQCSGMTFQKVGHLINKPPKKFEERIAKNALRASEFLEMVNGMGYDIKYVISKTGTTIKTNPRGHGRRVVSIIKGVRYNTSQSTALANDFYADGEHEYNDGRATELYVTKDGSYFFVDYTEFEGIRDRIIPVTSEIAQAFIEKHGYLE